MTSSRPPARHLLAVCAALVVLVAGVSGCSTSGSNQTKNGYITGEGQVLQIAPKDRRDVPDVKGESLTGESLDIADHRGEIVVLNVWASWCPPCRAEADDLVEAYDELADVPFIGIDTNEDAKSAAESFVREHDLPYDSIYDNDGKVMLAFYGMLKPDSLPSTMVIDKQGRIAALVLGQIDSSTLVGLVEDVEQES